MTPTLISLVTNVGIALISAAFAAGGAYLAVTTRLDYLEKTLERHEREIRGLRKEHREDVDKLHGRINGLGRIGG